MPRQLRVHFVRDNAASQKLAPARLRLAGIYTKAICRLVNGKVILFRFPVRVSYRCIM
jgi:hypothetical protein